VPQAALCKVHHREQLGPVVLIPIDEWAESLIDVFIDDLSLPVSLCVVSRRELDFDAQYRIELVPEVRYKLRASI
jgi:hypothetical protein